MLGSTNIIKSSYTAAVATIGGFAGRISFSKGKGEKYDHFKASPILASTKMLMAVAIVVLGRFYIVLEYQGECRGKRWSGART